MRQTIFTTVLAVASLLAMMSRAELPSDAHAMLIEFAAIPILQELELEEAPANDVSNSEGNSPNIENERVEQRVAQKAQTRTSFQSPATRQPQSDPKAYRRSTSEKIRQILRDADQIGSDANQSSGNADQPFAASNESTNSTATKNVGAIVQTEAEDPQTTFDERQPIDAEFTEQEANLAGNQFAPLDATHSNVELGQATTVSSPDVLSSGYDGLVDSFVGQMLATGCATPGQIPGTVSLLNPPFAADYGGSLATGWYAQANAIFLRPVGSSDHALSVDQPSDASRLDLGSLHDELAPGAATLIGIATGTSAVEFEWWSLFTDRDRVTEVDPTGNLSWLVPFGDLDIDPTGTAQLHQISSEFEVHSFELNKRHLLKSHQIGVLQFAYAWGVRFVRLRDELNFQADGSDTILDGSVDEYAYKVSADNRLFGPQIGGAAHWRINPRFAASLDVKTGVFYNYVEHDQSASTAIGPATIVSGIDTGSTYSVDNSDAQVALLAEVELNLEYAIRSNFRVLVGYRLFGVQNVASSESQIPRTFGNLSRIKPTISDSLLLHGLQVGFDANF